ncbi:MAG: hypothetical protein J6O41_08335 [Clostridia bacterium]|nr:hypothetical protein [Clostridia bacterium]
MTDTIKYFTPGTQIDFISENDEVIPSSKIAESSVIFNVNFSYEDPLYSTKRDLKEDLQTFVSDNCFKDFRITANTAKTNYRRCIKWWEYQATKEGCHLITISEVYGLIAVRLEQMIEEHNIPAPIAWDIMCNLKKFKFFYKEESAPAFSCVLDKPTNLLPGANIVDWANHKNFTIIEKLWNYRHNRDPYYSIGGFVFGEFPPNIVTNPIHCEISAFDMPEIQYAPIFVIR